MRWVETHRYKIGRAYGSGTRLMIGVVADLGEQRLKEIKGVATDFISKTVIDQSKKRRNCKMNQAYDSAIQRRSRMTANTGKQRRSLGLYPNNGF
jgi:hypothetical protein